MSLSTGLLALLGIKFDCLWSTASLTQILCKTTLLVNTLGFLPTAAPSSFRTCGEAQESMGRSDDGEAWRWWGCPWEMLISRGSSWNSFDCVWFFWLTFQVHGQLKLSVFQWSSAELRNLFKRLHPVVQDMMSQTPSMKKDWFIPRGGPQGIKTSADC